MSNAAENVRVLSEHGQLLTSQTADGSLVLDIRKSAGDAAAAFAYAFVKGHVNMRNVANREQLRGAILTVLPEYGSPIELSTRLKNERANTRSALMTLMDRLNADDTERAGQARRYLRRGSQIALSSLRKLRAQFAEAVFLWQASATAAIGDLKAVENAYREAMRLQAPVEYWRRKAAEHKGKERSAAKRLIAFFPIMTLLLLAVFALGGAIILGNAPEAGKPAPVALYFVVTAALAFASTVAFWIGRLLTKLYLSEHHLRNDAEERAIMTETYLALTNEGAAVDVDRQIILNALFRVTADGIVKDDGPSDLNLQALVSRLALKP